MNTEELIITGGRQLHGSIAVRGSKNSATKLLAAAILASHPVTLENVPDVQDVRSILALLTSMGVVITGPNNHRVTVDPRNANLTSFDQAIVRRLRASAVLLGALIAKFPEVRLPGPGGDQIGSRPLDTHLDAFRQLGIEVRDEDGVYVLRKHVRRSVDLTMSEFSVTATENVLLASVLADGQKTTIRCAAADPSVQDVVWFLQSMGARISGLGTSTLIVDGVARLTPTRPYTVMPDPVEAGTFICLAAATKSPLTITDVPTSFLHAELQKFREANVTFSVGQQRLDPLGHYEIQDISVRPPTRLRALRKVHNMPFPGFSPDLLPPFAVMMTQAEGTTLIHDWMYEGRLKYVEELNKMGAEVFVADPHRILVTGPRSLSGAPITNYDIRTGAAMVIAGLVASGTTVVRPAFQLDRGYERLDQRLNDIGASIVRKGTQ